MTKKGPEFVERAMTRARENVESWRERERLRKSEAKAHRQRLWREGVEREKSLAKIAVNEKTRPEVSEHQDAVFVHANGATRDLEELASRGARLAGVVPVSRSEAGDSWLIFDR